MSTTDASHERSVAPTAPLGYDPRTTLRLACAALLFRHALDTHPRVHEPPRLLDFHERQPVVTVHGQRQHPRQRSHDGGETAEDRGQAGGERDAVVLLAF